MDAMAAVSGAADAGAAAGAASRAGGVPAPPPDAAAAPRPPIPPPAARAPPEEDDEAVCRICRDEATPEEPLVAACRCNGSIGLIHAACLRAWLSRSGRDDCELCHAR
jgi:hypothetical protein